jgi:hypothetical protein
MEKKTNYVFPAFLALLGLIAIGNIWIIKPAKMESYSQDQSFTQSETSSEEHDYEIICGAFLGHPTKEQVKPLIEQISRRWSKENLAPLNIANAAVVLRKNSQKGITEM